MGALRMEGLVPKSDSSRRRRRPATARSGARPQPVPTWAAGLLVPGLATACAYSYWVGFGGVFGVPRQLISVAATDILVALGTLIVVFFYFNALTAFGYLLAPRLPWWIREPYSNLLPIAVVGSLFAIASRQSVAWVLLALALLAFVPLIYGIPLLYQRDKKGYANKLRADTERVRSNFDMDDELMGRSLFGALSRRFPQYALLLAVSIVVLLLSYVGGVGSAYSQSSFPVTTTEPHRVLMAVVADRAFLRVLKPSGPTGPLEVSPVTTLPPLTYASVDATQAAALRSRPWPLSW